MNRWGRKLLRAVVFGGAIVTGILLNSTDSRAAEIEPIDDAQLVQADQDENPEMTRSDELVQKMEDAVEVIEGDAVAEQAYNEQAKAEIENNTFDSAKEEEIRKAGQDVLDQAQEKTEQVQSIYKELKDETEGAKDFFEECTKEKGGIQFSERCGWTENNQQKIDILNEGIEWVNQDYENNKWIFGEKSDNYLELTHEIEKYEAEKQTEELNYNQAVKTYDDIEAEYTRIQNEINTLDVSLDSEKLAELRDFYNQQLAELDRMKQEFDESNAKFDEVYYERAICEEQVNCCSSN